MKKILSIFLSLMMLTSCIVVTADDTSSTALMLVSTSPDFGNDEALTEAPSFTFNNDIATASAQLNGEDVECTVDGKKVTLDVTLEQFTDYKATVSVTDANGQTASEKLYFYTGGSAGESITAGEGSSWHVNANGSTSMNTMMNIKYNNNSNFVFYSFPVPKIDDGQSLGSFVITCYTYAGSNVYSMKFAGDEWDGASMKTTDEAVATVFGDVSKKWNKSAYYAADSASSTAVEGARLMFEHKIDITSYVKECMDAGEASVEIGFVSNSTINLFGFFAKDSGYKKYQATYTYEVTEPKFEITDVSAEVSGSVLDSASFAILTDVEDIGQIVEIRTVSDKTSVDASFVYDEASSKYVLEYPVELVAGTEYEFVFKADSEDMYGNVNTDEKILAKFYASADDYEAVEKTEASEDEIFESSVNAETSTVSVFFKNPHYANSDVEIIISLEGSEEAAFSETVKSGKRGSIYRKDIELPESGSYEIKVFPKNASYYLASKFEFFSAEDTARLWTVVAQSGTAEEIGAEWDMISAIFGLDNEYLATVFNMDAFFTKIVESRGDSFAEMNAENISALKSLVSNLALFASIEQAEDEASAGELVAKALPLVRVADSEIASLWEECMESDHYDKTLTAFLADEVVVSSGADLAKLLDSALNVYRVENVFDLLENAEHSSEVTAIVTNERYAELLGITDILEDYEELKSKTSVNKELMKSFDNAEDFAKAFKDAVKEAKKDQKKPSSPSGGNGGGKGSSSFGGATQIVSSSPVEDTVPFNPFDDLKDYEWAKDHVAKLYNRGVINGKSHNKFAPSETISREEITKLLVSLGKFAKAENTESFADVESGSWYEEYVDIAVSNGLVKGVGNQKFGTGMKATRQDIAVMIVNMLIKLGVTVEEAELSFGDSSSVSDYAKNPVAFLASKGILTGDTFGNFNPKANATRAEVAVMLSRVCDIYAKEVK